MLTLTVGKLRELIRDLPDNTRVKMVGVYDSPNHGFDQTDYEFPHDANCDAEYNPRTKRLEISSS